MIQDSQKSFNTLKANDLPHSVQRTKPPASHLALEQLGHCVAVGGGRFLCAGCGRIGLPIFHHDQAMDEVFVISSSCRCIWGVWSAISEALDMEAQP